MFRELVNAGKLRKVQQVMEWEWWTEKGGKESNSKAGKGFEWLEKDRRMRKREEASSMFM